MKKYTVTVCRISYALREIEVEAKNQKEAKKLALDEASNRDFSEHTADYEVENIKAA